MVPTDCDFGPDGAFYWSDWVGGWDVPHKGRIFKVEDPVAMMNPAVAEAKKLLAEGLAKRPAEELLRLLGHEHREVRQEAQYELANRGEAVMAKLLAVVHDASNAKPRLHALLALGQIQRRTGVKIGLQPLAGDADPMIRATFAKVHGETGGDLKIYAKLFADESAAVRREAAIAYGKHKPKGSDDYKPLFALLKDNNNADAYLRHAAVQGLTTMTEQPCDLTTAFDAAVESDKSLDTPAVRLGVVLALRKLQCHRIGRFLNDADPAVVSEAARAIYDQELMSPMAELAVLADKPNLPEAVAYRALAANMKLGEPAGAGRLAAFAARSGEPAHLRVAALTLLADWATPPRRDAITGLAQTLPARDGTPAAEALKRELSKLIGGPDAVRSALITAVTKLNVKEVARSSRTPSATTPGPCRSASKACSPWTN